MILLNSIWLFALAALSIPVVIHLWNIRPGRTLKVGSITLIDGASQNSRSFKLHDLLLLLLRCLLLALLAFVLAMPLWQRHINSLQIKGWVLLPRENLKESYQKFKPTIDSLTKAGYEFHYFNKGFEKADLNKVLTDPKTVADSTTHLASYWSLIQRLDGQIPSSLPVYLFTPNRITYFNGEKPKVALSLKWQTYIPADSTSTWLAQAWFTNNNDIQVLQGNSKPSGTSYTSYTIQSASRNTPFIVQTDNGRMTVGLKNANTIAVDTSTWRFAIYAEKNSADANYLKAALGSIIEFTKHKAIIKQYADADPIPPHQRWIFWLSQKTVDKQLVKNGDNLFSYEPGKVKETSSWIANQNESLSKPKIALYKSVAANPDSGQVIWQDGFGNPILSRDKQQTNAYHFYSRFDPSWSDLVWNDDFPKMLLRLIIDQPTGTDIKYDRRAIDIKQILPASTTNAHNQTGKLIEYEDISRYLWIALLLVFITERWLAHKKAGKQVLQNG
jgi:hypothetical protein